MPDNNEDEFHSCCSSDSAAGACGICLCGMDCSALVLSCGHVFCSVCVVKLVARVAHVCPMCRASINLESVQPVSVCTGEKGVTYVPHTPHPNNSKRPAAGQSPLQYCTMVLQNARPSLALAGLTEASSPQHPLVVPPQQGVLELVQAMLPRTDAGHSPTKAAASAQQPFNAVEERAFWCFLVDGSRSMGNAQQCSVRRCSRGAFALAAITSLLHTYAGPQDEFSVCTFSSSFKVVQDWTECAVARDEEPLKRLQVLQARVQGAHGRGSCLYAAGCRAFDRMQALAGNMSVAARFNLVVICDGQSDREDALANLQRFRQKVQEPRFRGFSLAVLRLRDDGGNVAICPALRRVRRYIGEATRIPYVTVIEAPLPHGRELDLKSAKTYSSLCDAFLQPFAQHMVSSRKAMD